MTKFKTHMYFAVAIAWWESCLNLPWKRLYSFKKKIYNFKLFLYKCQSEPLSDRTWRSNKNLNIMFYCLFINEIDYFLCATLLEKKTWILLHNKLPYLLVWFSALYSFSKKRRRKIFFSLKYFCTTWIHMIYTIFTYIYITKWQQELPWTSIAESLLKCPHFHFWSREIFLYTIALQSEW